MVNIRVVVPSRLKWRTPKVLYRGTYQEQVERRILSSIVKGEPAYYGFVTIDDEKKRTYVSTDPFQALLSAEHRFDEAASVPEPWTRYPLIMSIHADKYLDKLRASSEGEGIFIEDSINPNDISILLSSECDRLRELTGRHITEDEYLAFIRKVEQRGFNKGQSLVKKYCQQGNLLGLEGVLRGRFTISLTSTASEHQPKIVEAMAYLKRKLEGH